MILRELLSSLKGQSWYPPKSIVQNELNDALALKNDVLELKKELEQLLTNIKEDPELNAEGKEKITLMLDALDIEPLDIKLADDKGFKK